MLSSLTESLLFQDGGGMNKWFAGTVYIQISINALNFKEHHSLSGLLAVSSCSLASLEQLTNYQATHLRTQTISISSRTVLLMPKLPTGINFRVLLSLLEDSLNF